MATRPPREPRGSRVMLRRCIFLISTSENFVSRYPISFRFSPSYWRRSPTGPTRSDGASFGYTSYRPNRAEQTAIVCKEYFIVTRRLSNKTRILLDTSQKRAKSSVGSRETCFERQMVSRLYVQNNCAGRSAVYKLTSFWLKLEFYGSTEQFFDNFN